jgi:GH18 family chitinase
MVACAILLGGCSKHKQQSQKRVTSETGSTELRCVGYLASWDYGVYNSMDWSALTHLNIAFYYPDAAGNMTNPFDNDQTLKNIVAKAHANGVKVMASIRDCDLELFTASKRTGFIQKIMDHVQKFNLDGVDSDLEKREADFWTNYEPFIVSLRAECNKRGLLLTTAVSTWFSDNITDRTFACFDFINLMAYDLGFANHSTVEGMTNMVAHYRDVRKIPTDKIVIGVPFYGYNKNRADNDPEGWGDAKWYRQIIAEDPGAWNVDVSGDYVYNGAATIAAKSRFARDYGGVMIWHLGQDAAGDKALLKVIGKNLFESGRAPRPVGN